jgi:hypothetical protein
MRIPTRLMACLAGAAILAIGCNGDNQPKTTVPDATAPGSLNKGGTQGAGGIKPVTKQPPPPKAMPPINKSS